MSSTLKLKSFPGALYAGDGTLLAGDGPEITEEFAEGLPFKAFISGKPLNGEAVVLKEGDRIWLLPDSFGAPPVLPTPLLTDLADLVRAGHRVGLAACEREPYEQARDALVLLLDDSGGQA